MCDADHFTRSQQVDAGLGLDITIGDLHHKSRSARSHRHFSHSDRLLCSGSVLAVLGNNFVGRERYFYGRDAAKKQT